MPRDGLLTLWQGGVTAGGVLRSRTCRLSSLDRLSANTQLSLNRGITIFASVAKLEVELKYREGVGA